jgi:glycosyltransferase involved in cell wall biosynthesis
MKQLLVYSTQLMETGGIESHVLEFCGHMSASGVGITLIVPNFHMKAAEKERLKAACVCVYANKGKAGVRTMAWLFFKAFFLGFKHFDALYTNGQGESLGIFARLIRHKKNWVHHHHTAGDKLDQATWGKWYWQTLKRANSVIACSTSNASDMKKVLDRKIDVVPCFSRKVVVQRQHLFNPEKIQFGYYGRLIKEKGIDDLCKLSNDADCSKIQFNIWGKGQDYPPTFFAKYAHVKYHGTFTGLQGLKNVIASLDAFLLLSTHPEGLPICLLEAMGAGLPWLATDKGGVRDIAFDSSANRVIASNSDYEEMKKQVILLAEDLAKGRVNRLNQVAVYDEKFAATSLVNQWQEILQLSN